MANEHTTESHVWGNTRAVAKEQCPICFEKYYPATRWKNGQKETYLYCKNCNVNKESWEYKEQYVTVYARRKARGY